MTRPVALVTGSASNIGRATAERFAADYRVVLADVADTTGVARVIGGDALPVRCDVTDPKDCARVVAAAAASGPLEAVVHSAAVTGPPVAIADMSDDEWLRVIHVNLTGSFFLLRACIPALRRAGQGSVVIIASRAGKTGFAALSSGGGPTKAHYCASKAGVISLTKSLALELAADRIRVNGIAPGPIEGTMIPRERWADIGARVPLGRMGRPQEIADAAHFLCSPAAGFVTGHILDVNGGTLMD